VLPTFVIGLREGLEAALIVGIIAAFLGQQNRRDALRQLWSGTAAAVAVCAGGAIALQVISADLPQRGQEGLETVVGALAVAMVTYMILFMRRQAEPGKVLQRDRSCPRAGGRRPGHDRAQHRQRGRLAARRAVTGV
jgi:FTR1 family protein